VCENQKNPKIQKIASCCTERERRREKKRTRYYSISSHKEEKKKRTLEPRTHYDLISHIIMMMMCVKIRKIQKSRKIESSERERVDIPREREREIFQNRKKYYLDKLSSYVIYTIYISTFKHLDRW